MGIDLTLTGAGDYPNGESITTRIGTNQGYNLISKWFSELPSGVYPALEALNDEMEFTPTDVLSNQLLAAMKDHPPKSEEDEDMVSRLFELIGDGNENETARIKFGG